MKFPAQVELDHLVEAEQTDQVTDPVHTQVGLAVGLHGEQGQRAAVAQGEQAADESLLLLVSLDHQAQHPVQLLEEAGVVAGGPVSGPRQVDRDILQGAEAHLPGRGRLGEIGRVEHEGEAAALRDLGRFAPVEDEVGVALFGRRPADVGQVLLGARCLEELVGQVAERLREEEGSAQPVSLEIDLEESPGELLGLRLVFGVGLAGILTARADGRRLLEVVGDLPVNVDVAEDGLAAASHRLLAVLVDQHLGQLLDVPVRHPLQVRGEEVVDRVPADGAGEVALEGGRELHHVRQERLAVAGRLGDGEGVGQREAEFFDVLQRLAAAVRPVAHAQVVQVDITGQMGVGHLGREDLQQGVLLLDRLGQREVGRLRVVRYVGILLVGEGNHLAHVVKGHAEPGMAPPLLLEAVLDQLGIHHLADQRRGQRADLGGDDLLLHLEGDDLGDVPGELGLPAEGVDDALPVPGYDIVLAGPHEEGQVGRFAQAVDFGRRELQFIGEDAGPDLADAGPPLAVKDIGLGRLGVAGLDQDLFHDVLDLLHRGNPAGEFAVQVDDDRVGQVFGQAAVAAAHRLGRLEDGVDNFFAVHRDNPAVPFFDRLNLVHDWLPVFSTGRFPFQTR
ncbi:MAG: hypothetical protein BWY73_00817 [candidate division TA06 bacterium ADurb.Bin417]|uniref:Uncharacterized protein n=1 Tax=candidate division TA06 bacterium ADurb.Bin417 TaxID=1852828 RepID=A0A1V5MHZ7_UNCT6|nr:MAG: hypothetical protein BWY73_00817 [candidate division TA06 bacterium ADurb.Bin417]